MNGIKFGDKHSFDDFGLYLKEKEIGFPKPKRETVEVEGRDGSLDLSLTDDVKFENRDLSFTFQTIGNRRSFLSIMSEISNAVHGLNLKVILDDDKGYYYEGNVTVNKFKSDKLLGEIVIDVDAQPYKMEVNGCGDEWEWDTFSFVDGIIHAASVTVSGTATVNLINLRKVVYPTFECSSAMTATLNGMTINLKKGTNKAIDFQLKEGSNEVTFKGNGTVAIKYRGGSL